MEKLNRILLEAIAEMIKDIKEQVERIANN